MCLEKFSYNAKKSLKTDKMVDFHQHLNQTHQGALSQRISVTRVTASACDYESPAHEHAQGQLVLALAGGVRCAINGQVWMVPPQGAVWIPPHHVHTNYVTHNAEVCMAFIAADIGLAAMPAGTIAVSAVLQAIVLQLADLQAASALHQGVDADEVGINGNEQEYAQRLMDVLLLELPRAQPQAYAIPVLQHPRLQPLYQQLLAQPQNRDSSHDWAERLAISERTLLRLVKQDTGLSFARWRQQVQLLHALLQLAAGHSVQQVSMDLGYESVSAFITVFKKRLGTTPKRYFAASISSEWGMQNSTSD